MSAVAPNLPEDWLRDEPAYAALSRVNNELVNLQRSLAKANAELARANEDKARLLAMASHDLRSPLCVVLSHAEFLETEAADRLDAEQRGFVLAIREASQGMLGLIDDLLDVSAIASGRLTLAPRHERLGPLLERAIASHRVLAARKRIAVVLAPGVDLAALPPLRFDAARLRQVLDNLLGNAVKFSHPGTTVSVGAALVADGPAGPGLQVSVADQGQGIPADDLPLLFKPYGRTRVRATGGERSTGLGLAIAHKIVNAHGGRMTVDSTPGRGSCFGFTLPLATDDGDEG